MQQTEYTNVKQVFVNESLKVNNRPLSSKNGIPKYIRNNNNIKSTNDKNKLFCSPRKNEKEAIKAKPRLLTERLPTAFLVQDRNSESHVDLFQGKIKKRVNPEWVKYNNTEAKEYSGANIKMKRHDEVMPSLRVSQNNLLSEPTKTKTNNDTKSYNYSQDKDKNINPPSWYSSLTKNEEHEAKEIISRPIYVRGSSAYPGSYDKLKPRVDNNTKWSNYSGNKSNHFNVGDQKEKKINIISVCVNKEVGNNSNSNNKHYSSFSINSASWMNQTLKNYLPKIQIEEKEIQGHQKEIQTDNFTFDKIRWEDGITYQTNSNYKLYFHIPSMKVFILKEIGFANSIGLVDKLCQWKKESSYFQHGKVKGLLKDIKHDIEIINYYVNNPEGFISILFENPCGETLSDIISSTGFLSHNWLFTIITQLLGVNNRNKKSNSIDVFCPCDIYLDIDSNVKYFPENIRSNISTTSCPCKTTLNNIMNKYSNSDTFWYISLGYLIIKCIAGNMPLKCIELFCLGYSEKNNNKECCLLHSLLKIEDTFLNPDEFVLLKNILKWYSVSLMKIICEWTSYSKTKDEIIIKLQRYAMLNTPKDTPGSVLITMGELLSLVKNDNNKHITIESFLNSFAMIFKNWNMTKREDQYYERYNTNYFNKLKVQDYALSMLSKCFDLEMNEIVERLKNKIFGTVQNKKEIEVEMNNYLWNGNNKVFSH